MNILQVAYFDIGACGPTSVLRQVISNLDNNDKQIDVFSAYAYSEERKKLANSLEMGYYYSNGENIISQKNIIKYIPSIKDYDIVHIHGIYNINHIILASYLYKNNIPYIVTIHGNLMKESLKRSKFKKKMAINLLIRKMLRRASTIHVLAKEELKDVKSIVGNHNYTLIYNGVKSLDCKKENKLVEDGKKNILFIGRLDVNHKGLDILFDAIESKASFFKDKLFFYIVGPFNSDYDKSIITQRLSHNSILKEIISIEGAKYSAEKEAYFDKSDLFIHTSRYEGMPVAVLEAMEAGLPSIVTPGTNMATIIRESKGGFVTNETVEDVANVLEYVCKTDKETLRKIGKSAKRWSNENLRWELIAYQYEQMYLKAINIRRT